MDQHRFRVLAAPPRLYPNKKQKINAVGAMAQQVQYVLSTFTAFLPASQIS